ncbi:UDP-glucose 4-epimerase [Agrobacterium vitis]|uniref:NAD-dependent epimerase/dehydratase family protein n=1 Tax=Agrobacterium vitis TaxID=373 RepID=UPI0015D6C3D3|nr:NAD(P)-dependent oxidoreductase [Agrobacterium vitis]BCH59218.1 UDP-glucose 4-epimerase [Agrobacterium vitis]
MVESSRESRRYLISGAGMLGSHVAAILVHRGDDVTVLDKAPDARDYLCEVSGTHVPFVAADVRDQAAVLDLIQRIKPNAVFHSAGVMENYFDNELQAALEINIAGSASFIKAAFDAGVPHVVHASSLAVYDFSNSDLRLTETSSKTVDSEYGFAKLYVEDWIERYARRIGATGISLRFAGIYGWGEFRGEAWMGKILQDTVKDLMAGCEESVSIRQMAALGDNEYLYVDDAANITITALEKRQHLRCNVGAGTISTSAEVILALRQLFPHCPSLDFRSADLPLFKRRLYPLDISLARRELQYEPKVSLYEGLRAMRDKLAAL